MALQPSPRRALIPTRPGPPGSAAIGRSRPLQPAPQAQRTDREHRDTAGRAGPRDAADAAVSHRARCPRFRSAATRATISGAGIPGHCGKYRNARQPRLPGRARPLPPIGPGPTLAVYDFFGWHSGSRWVDGDGLERHALRGLPPWAGRPTIQRRRRPRRGRTMHEVHWLALLGSVLGGLFPEKPNREEKPSRSLPFSS